MKTKRTMTLAQALHEIASVSEEIRSRGGALVDGQEFKLEDPVTLEIESESSEKKTELEFEIEFKRAGLPEGKARKRGRRNRARFILGAAVAAVVAAALMRGRRRRREDDGGKGAADK